MQAKTELMEKEKIQKDNTNYSFILKCLGALTAAALITAGIIAAVATKASAVALASVAAKTMFVAAAVAPPIAPIIGIIVLIGALCLLPLLFIRTNSATVVAPSHGFGSGWGSSWFGGGWGRSTVYSAPPVYSGSGGPLHHHNNHGNPNQHGHPTPPSGHPNQHGHQQPTSSGSGSSHGHSHGHR